MNKVLSLNEKIEALQNKKYYDGLFVGSYNTKMEVEVTKLLATVDDEGLPPLPQTRIDIIDAIFDAYVIQTGQIPEGTQVQRLANWLLLEDLTDNHPDKVTREAYPFMTKRQLRTRYNRERADENIPETLTQQKYLGGKKQSTFMKQE